MNLYIDCEFNETQGDLISMALVSDSGHEFYEVVECPNPMPWVAEHVIPILHKCPISYMEFQSKLQTFLSNFGAIHLIADWPEDIKLFCQALITAPGKALQTPPLTMQIVPVDSESELPHNALYDAIAIRTAVHRLSTNAIAAGDCMEKTDEVSDE